MAVEHMTIDTRQLDRLTGELAAFPRDVLNAIRSSLFTGIRNTLTTVIPKYYALDPKKIKKTFHVRDNAYRDGWEDGIRFEVAGRRLSLTHFEFSPREPGAPRPTVEIVRGHVRRASMRMMAGGWLETPFIMSTGAKSSEKESLNLFIHTGRRARLRMIEFQSRKGPAKFMAWQRGIQAYRTVSVPQMLGHKQVVGEVQDNLLSVFDDRLFKNIERRTGVMQENIARG